MTRPAILQYTLKSCNRIFATTTSEQRVPRDHVRIWVNMLRIKMGLIHAIEPKVEHITSFAFFYSFDHTARNSLRVEIPFGLGVRNK
ncbi:hypothetical protein CUV01_06510 [Paracoccus tegillarcae]|uniref:Uncharacterized protein n=1 Tax=Paracoccus tegillarcae TaxID=1529068 RepID=A0A2K9EIA0_9RHOB|nr:hypothetical protein CUV01_06510 [Paracoccus tegillarcae]